jgi:hypothetical protein
MQVLIRKKGTQLSRHVNNLIKKCVFSVFGSTFQKPLRAVYCVPNST